MRSEHNREDESARQAATDFVENESAFHLGFLPTEQGHPMTRDLSATAARSATEAVDEILAVDGELASVARRTVLSVQFEQLIDSLSKVMVPEHHSGNLPRVCFSGCGSTGRLAIMLEAMWRSAFTGNHAQADQARSVMTGGDRALIRAVESFEDYEAFGARQIADMELTSGDVVIAVSEGGETSSVIGTVEEAVRRGCTVFFIYNNPTTLLHRHIDRSRKLIENPHVTTIDLFSGPMALSGSTRMQATTLEMIVLGIAMEEALIRTGHAPDSDARAGHRTEHDRKLLRVDSFVRLLKSLRRPHNLETIATLAKHEAELYTHGGRITYFADDYLLDIFSDTTERSPTFMLPPFRASYDTTSAVSWAFAKNPKRPTVEAWEHMLGRPPRGIEWTSADYEEMGAKSDLIHDPPKLDLEEIQAYSIGRETDQSRWTTDHSVALWVDVEGSLADHLSEADLPDPFRTHDMLTVRSVRPRPTAGGTSVSSLFHQENEIVAEIESSPIRLFHHLAIKLIFNTFSTCSMALTGRVLGNWMIQLDPTNKKLIDRGTRIVAELSGLDYERACYELHLSMENRKRDGVRNSESPVVTTLRRLGVSV
jgi:N-acetylmuramic acid 6-phosphate etherase